MTDMSGPIKDAYNRARKNAEDAERKGDKPAAAAAYHQAAEMMRRFAQYAMDPGIRKQRLQRAEVHEKAAQSLAKGGTGPLAGKKQCGEIPTKGKKQPDVSTGEDDYEAEVLSLIEKSDIRWDDIGGLQTTKDEIRRAYGMALARKPSGVHIQSGKNLLFYGPPGTGKTLLAAATAGSLEATFFNVKVSNLLSKYFGESTKLVSALFTVARRMNPAVIFLDEFEALTPPRGTGESGAERRIVSTMLAEMDGLETKSSDAFVLTIGATNLPWLVDNAIFSRFQQRIYIPLPDENARRAILDIHLTKRGHKFVFLIDDLVKRTEGYSGREIEQLCGLAIANMSQRMNPDLLPIVDRGQDAIREYMLKVEPLNKSDFERSFETIPPIVTKSLLQRYEDWAKKVDG